MHRTVDGFVKRSTVQTVRRQVQPVRSAPVAQQPKAVKPPMATPVTRKPPARAAPTPIAPIQNQFSQGPRPYQVPAKPARARRQLPQWLELSLIMVGTCIAGMCAQTLVLGQLLIAAYTLFALIFNVASRTTFTLALLSMVATVGLLVMGTNEELAGNFITYTFLLLVAGVITLARELRREGGRLYTSRKHNI